MAYIYGTSGSETLSGTSAGGDVFVLAGGNDTVNGTVNSNEAIDLSKAPNAVNIDLSAGTMTGWGTAQLHNIQQVVGSPFGGTITAAPDTNYVIASGGDTVINGGSASMYIVLGTANDTVHAGTGDDTVYVGQYAGQDGGNNLIDGGAGYVTVDYVNSPASVVADLYVGAWHDGIADTFQGNVVNVIGNNGGDTLLGTYQDNILVGGTGNDYIDGRDGNDTLTGGGGADTFVMDPAVGNDTITDFKTATDVIDVSAFFSDFRAVQAATTQNGANALIQLGAGHSITLDGVSASSLTASDFSFSPVARPSGTTGSGPATTVEGTAANNYTATFQGVYRDYIVGSGAATVTGGPESANDTLTNVHRVQFVDGYLATSPTDTAGEVYRLYEATLARAPDQEGLTNWTNALDGGESLQTVAAGFVGSTEFQNTYGSLDNTGFVNLLYNNVLHRSPDTAGLNNWVNELNTGHSRAEVVLGFSQSQEDINDLAAPVQHGLWVGNADAAEVARLYDTVLGRLPDLSGLTSWTHSLEGGTSLQTVAVGFTGSTEFQSVYGSLNNTDFVEQLYQNTLHRPADSAGLNNWVDDLNSGDSRAQVVLGFSESPEHMANTAAHIDQGIWVTG